MMRILFLSTWYPYPADNGSKIRVKYLLQALAKRHEVTLLSFSFATARPDLRHGLPCKVVKIVEIDPFSANQTSEIRRYSSLTPVNYRPIAPMQQLTDRTLAETSFDAVIASTELMATYALQAKKDTKKVLEEHNSLTRQMRERYENSSGVRSIRNWLSWQKSRRYERQLFSKFDLISMVSRQDVMTSRQIMRRSPGTLLLIPNGVDCIQNQLGFAAKKPYRLIFSGSLTYHANYDAMAFFLAQIYPLIRAKTPGVELQITGSIEGVDVKSLALDNSVVPTGFVEDIRQNVAASMVCVVPLQQGGGTRLKILEAMALGTPVVTTSKGAEGLEVVNGEHLIIANNPRDFANDVVNLLEDSALQRRLVYNARKLVEEQYDWNRIGKQFATDVENSVTYASAG